MAWREWEEDNKRSQGASFQSEGVWEEEEGHREERRSHV